MESLLDCSKDELWGIDLETNGLDASDPSQGVVGIGLACSTHCFYIDITTATAEARTVLREFLEHARLVAFNVNFDAAWLVRLTGRWLNWEGCSYGLFKQMSTEGFPGQRWDLETAQRDVLGWPESNKDALNAALKERNLTKGEMYKLPADILGPYCALDADAALQLWDELVKQIKDQQFDELLVYHQREFMNEIELLVEAQLRGIYVDRDALLVHLSRLNESIQAALDSFLNHHEVAPHLARHQEDVLTAWMQSAPPKFTKKGEVSKRWEQWLERKDKFCSDNAFNPNSKQQLAVLFYEWLGYDVPKTTATGRPAVDKKVLPYLGEPGRILNEYNLYVKERGYVEAVLAKSERDGLIHPQFKSVGTLTGRLGGSGGLNLQQLPKSRGFLECIRARPGHKLVQFDWNALEPTVLAEFSQDQTLLKLYGDGANPAQDVYLFNGYFISTFADKIRRYYDADNPTPEMVAIAKKECKTERTALKLEHLSWQYGVGAAKLQSIFKEKGLNFTLEECRRMIREKNKLYRGVKRHQKDLEEFWHQHGGYVFNISGRPLAVSVDLLKDCTSREIQSSGHDFLQTQLYYINKLRKERGVRMWPTLLDLHDETFWECPETQAEQAAQVIIDARDLTNEYYGMGVTVRGEPEIINSLADAKCE